jgi:hypothetical protein
MELSVDEGTIVLEPLEGMAGVTVHVVVTVRSSTIRKKDHDLVNGLWVLGEVVLRLGVQSLSSENSLGSKYPKHVRVLQMGLGMPLLSVNKVGEFGGVTDEEDGGVIEDPIPVTLISSELDGEATGVASGIGRARFTTDSGETDCCADSLSHRPQQRLRSDVTEIMGDLEVTVSTSTFGMDNSLRNALSVKVSEEVNVVEVLKEERAVDASPLSSIWLGDGCAV